MAEEKKPTISYRQILHPEIRKIDLEARTVEFVASDSSVDSDGTVIPADKWDLKRYEKNGVVGYMHDVYGDSWVKASDPDDVIGYAKAWVEDDKLIAAVTFEPAELNPKADKIFRKIQFGSLNAVSVGFDKTAPGHWGNEDDGEDPDVYYYNGQELLEISVVNIPANANAVRRSISETLPPKPKRPAGQDVETIKKKELTVASARLCLVQNNQ